MTERRRFLVALLIEGSIGREVDGLRRALGSSELERIAPHITLVPPRNVAEDDVFMVLDQLQSAASLCGALQMELGPPRSFVPPNGVAFLAVGGDLFDLEKLRRHFATGVLSPPALRPERAFIAHVTLASRLEQARLEGVCALLSAYRKKAVIERLSLLEQDKKNPLRRWKVVSDVELGASVLRGRGGRELTFHVGSFLDERAERFLAALRGDGGVTAAPGGEGFSISAYLAGAIVGAASATLHGEICEITALGVGPRRNEGIGTQLLSELERHAREKGAARAVVASIERAGARSFFAARGYQRVGAVPLQKGEPSECVFFERWF